MRKKTKKVEPVKEDGIEVDGIIVKVHANTRCDVEISDGVVINAYVSGKMRQNFIRVLAGDKVVVMLSPYDLTQGRIIRRMR